MPQLVPINITGQQYQSRSGQLSNQVTQNFYAELVEDAFGKAQYVLQPTPGALLFGSAPSGTDRGIFEHLGVLYHVCGTVLYTVDSAGTHTSRGTIAGTDRVIFTAINMTIIVVANAGANIYQWNGTTLSAITDGDLETPQSATHLNNQIIYQGDNGRFCVSDVGDATSVDGLNYASAESSADDLVRVYAFSERLFLFGQKTIEIWWNSGQGNPPFDRVEGGIMQVGLDAKHSVASNDHRMYWLGDDKQVYMLADGASQQAVSNIAMHNKVSAYATTSDAAGFTFTFEGQEFYCLAFPTSDKTWLFNEKTGWTTLSSGAAGARSIANGLVYVFGKLIISEHTSANLHEWSATTYQDNLVNVVRIRDSAPVHGGLYGAPGKRVEQNDLRMIMEIGGAQATDIASVYYPAGVGSVSTPDSVANTIVGNIEIRAKLTLDTWKPSATQIICFKGINVGQWQYGLTISSGIASNDGKLQLTTYENGSAGITAQSSISLDTVFGVNETGWVRVVAEVDINETTFYTSTDGVTWAPFGDVSTQALAVAFDGNEALVVGPVEQRIHEVWIYDEPGGTVLNKMSATDWDGTSSWASSSVTGETWSTDAPAPEYVNLASVPSIVLSISDDGGKSFGPTAEADVGAASDFVRVARWNALGSFTDQRILRVSSTDKVFFSIHGATSYIDVGI